MSDPDKIFREPGTHTRPPGPPPSYRVPVNPWNTTRAIALLAAVIHHGMANFAADSVPAGSGTVIETAKKFELYLLS